MFWPIGAASWRVMHNALWSLEISGINSKMWCLDWAQECSRVRAHSKHHTNAQDSRLLLPIELLTCGISVAKHISGKLNESYLGNSKARDKVQAIHIRIPLKGPNLHSKAYAQVWFFPDSGEMRSVRLQDHVACGSDSKVKVPTLAHLTVHLFLLSKGVCPSVMNH
eukprot:3427929-Amphidinium_carterae.1